MQVADDAHRAPNHIGLERIVVQAGRGAAEGHCPADHRKNGEFSNNAPRLNCADSAKHGRQKPPGNASDRKVHRIPIAFGDDQNDADHCQHKANHFKHFDSAMMRDGQVGDDKSGEVSTMMVAVAAFELEIDIKNVDCEHKSAKP